MDFLAGTAASIPVTFKVNGEPRPPDVGTAAFALYGQDGALLTSGALTTTTTTTSLLIAVSAPHNTITLRFEKRTLVVSWMVGGYPYTQQISYRLIPFLNHVVTPQKVRSHLGIEPHELPDEDVDLSAAYFELEDEFGQAEVAAALSSGTRAELAMNDALLYTAALAKIPGLQMRVAQSNTDGRIGFARPVVKDWATIHATTAALRDAALDTAFNRAAPSYTLIQATQDTDIITGA